MDINSSLLKVVDEIKYLNVENTWRYRCIMRFFYFEYEKMEYWLYKEDIFNELKKHSEFSLYTMDDLKQDLDTLVINKNLESRQDTSKVSTIEEFKNKQFRYQISKYSIEIERMLIKLENLKIEGSSLSPDLLQRFKDDIKKIDSMEDKDIKVVGSWWNGITNDFKLLNTNYNDYMKEFFSARADELMKTKEFIVYKDKFIDYLRGFVKGLQQNSYLIESILNSVDNLKIKNVIDRVVAYEKSIPRIDYNPSESEIRSKVEGTFESIRKWFISEYGRESEVNRLFAVTDEIIRKITRYAYQISESSNSMAGRKEEYKKIASLFCKCTDINEAHKLSSMVFGIFNMRHIKGEFIRETDSINNGIFDEKPINIEIKPKVRGYREKLHKTPIPDNSAAKRKILNEYIRKQEEEKKEISVYINSGKINFSSLPVLKPSIRVTLLKWLSKGLSSADKKGRTEDGHIYKVVLPDDMTEKCTIKCEDGEFTMPKFIIEFEKAGNKNE